MVQQRALSVRQVPAVWFHAEPRFQVKARSPGRRQGVGPELCDGEPGCWAALGGRELEGLRLGRVSEGN